MDGFCGFEMRGRKLTPDAGVVGLELKRGEARGTDGLDVAAGWVSGVAGAAVPDARAFVEDVHVVAVKMEGVGEGGVVGDVQDDGVVPVEVVDRPLGLKRVGDVALGSLEEEWLVEVGAEGLVVDLPLVVSGGIHDEREFEVLHEGVRRRRDLVVRNSVLKRVVDAVFVL